MATKKVVKRTVRKAAAKKAPAKKPATKKAAKAPTKRAYVRKAPVTKKAVTKRKYTRKHAQPSLVEREAERPLHEQILNKFDTKVAAVQSEQPDQEGRPQSFGEFLSKMLGVENGADQAEPGNESPLELLRQIQVIDLRDVSVKDRFQILVLLASEGYITSTVESLIENLDYLRVGLEAEALVLQHENKLVRPAYWPEIEAGDYQAISRPSVSSSKISIGFSLPEPAYPNTTRIGDAFYVRVS